MASDSQRRPRSKSWVRGEPVTLTQNNCAGHNRVWTRPQLPGSGAAQTTAAQPVTVPWDVASIAAKQQLPHVRATRQQQDVLPLPHARTGRTDASSARQGLQATDVPLGTVPIPNSASGSSFSQQYVRKRPNQLTLSGSQQPASQAGAAAWPRPFAPSSGVPPGGQPASMLVPHRQAAAAVPRFAGATHPRDGLQQQMAERAAALAGRSPTRMQLHSMASAPAAAAPGLMQPVASGARGPAAPTGCKTRQKAASKKWVRPELAANSCTAGAGGSAAAGAAASTSARGGAPSQRKGLATASAAAVRTPSRAYRPVLPAWAARGSGPRSGSKAASSTPASHRQQHAGLRARRKARTWVRQDSQTSSIGTLLQPSAAVALLKHLRKGARTWHREAVNAAASEGAATPAATAQAMAAPPIRQTAQLTPHHLGRQPKRSRRAGNSQATVQRPAKLQRIDGQMYRVGGGKGRSRTLQRQPHTPAPAVSTPAQLLKQASAGKAHLYSVRGKFRRTVVRRLSGTPGSPASLQGSAAARRKLRGSPFATRSGGIRKRTPVSRLSRQPRAKSAKLPPQIYCTEFCRTGRCKDRQRCRFVHDASKVAVCPKWLQGRCDAADCPLQHRQQPDLMPVCTFFLQGGCSKTDCPYLHVKLDPIARICEAFLRGWCPAGAGCREKHLTPEMVRQLRRERVLRPGAQAKGRAKQGKRKRYFEVDSAMDAGAAAGPVGAAAVAADLAEAASASEGDDDRWESASDSEVEPEGLAWGDFMHL